MTDHHHPITPHIPIPANRPLTTCSPAIERRIRQTLCWHAGDCGLIETQAADAIVAMLLDGSLAIDDLWILASRPVYAEIFERWYEILQARKK
jgi:hypothetical protein